MDVFFKEDGSFSSPPPEAREKMMLKVKELFSDEIKTEVSPWCDLAASLWVVVQQLPLFNKERMMVKIKNIDEDRARGQFKFREGLVEQVLSKSWHCQDWLWPPPPPPPPLPQSWHSGGFNDKST